MRLSVKEAWKNGGTAVSGIAECFRSIDSRRANAFRVKNIRETPDRAFGSLGRLGYLTETRKLKTQQQQRAGNASETLPFVWSQVGRRSQP